MASTQRIPCRIQRAVLGSGYRQHLPPVCCALRWCRNNLRALVALMFLAALVSSEASADDSWLSRPYRVRIVVDPPSEEISEAVRVALGPACRVDEPAGKELRISLTRHSGDVEIAVQEDDLWLHDVGPLVVRQVPDSRLIPEVTAQLAELVFRRRVLITRDGESYRAHVWGERLDADLIRSDAWFTTFLRFRDREANWRQTNSVPWTYLRLGERESLVRSVEIVSGFPNPLPGRLRRGDVVALESPATEQQTTIQLVDAKNGQVRPGLNVQLVPVKFGDQEGEEQEPLHVMADRRGEFTLPEGIGSMVRVRVMSTTVVADVPVQPGKSSRVVVPIVGDSETVNLDEQLSFIEQRLKDLIARRSVLVAKIKSDVEAKLWDSAEKTIKTLDDLPKADSLIVDLNAARVAAVDSALAQGDRLQASRLRRKAARLERTLKTFADPIIDDAFRDEMEALRSIEKAKSELDPAEEKDATTSE